MDLIQKTITKLLDKPPLGLAGSIYIPTSPQASPPHLSADRTRFKNAIQHIKNLENYDEQMLGDSIKRLEDVLDDMEFWQHQDLGLMALFDADTVEIIKLPFEVSEAEYLADHFVLSPLIAMEAINTNFYLLDMNFTSPRLFYGAHGQLQEVNQANMPKSFEEEVASEEYRRHLQHQSGGVGAYHGHTEKTWLMRSRGDISGWLLQRSTSICVMKTFRCYLRVRITAPALCVKVYPTALC